jgi:hypothetical protein
VYVTGSTAVKTFLGTVAQVLARSDIPGQTPYTIVYQGQGSCVGVDAMLKNVPIKGTASYWDPNVTDLTQAERKCDLPADGILVDIGASDVFASTCSDLPQGLPSNIGDFFGPVQVMTFVTPQASTQRAISAEAAYFVFGFGADSGVTPWTNEDLLFRRSATSGTQGMIAKTIGVPASQWRGKENKSSDDVKNKLLAVPADQADAALGILSADIADDLRGQLRVLAYQDYKQNCSFYPDATPTASNKQNVRDGHYPIWGPLHLLVRLVSGVPSDIVQQIVGQLSGAVDLPNGINLIQLYAQKHVIPLCAMHVSRGSDGGGLKSFAPEKPCGCYYDSLVTGQTSCPVCKGKGDCPATAPNCSYGYCEP